MRIFFGSGILLLLFFKSMILKKIYLLGKRSTKARKHMGTRNNTYIQLLKIKKNYWWFSMCNVDLFPGWFSLYIYIYILMSKEQLLVYSYYSCRAHNIIHYSCKSVQQVHTIPYNFVHIEYKLYNI